MKMNMKTKTLVCFCVATLMLFAAMQAPVPGDRPVHGIDPGTIARSLPGNRTSPITITSDADYPLYASGGDGTPGNPWVLEDYVIECNGTGGGIAIAGCDDHAIIRNSYINETDAVSAGIGIQGSSNIVIDNITVESGLLGFAFISSHDVVLNNSFAYSYSLGGVYTDSSWDITIDSTTVEMRGANGAPVYLGTLNTGNGSTRVSIENCTFVGNASSYLFYSYSSNDVTIEGSTIYNGTRCYFYSTENVAVNGCNITSAQSVFYFQSTCTNVSVNGSVLVAGTNGIFSFSSATGDNVNVTYSTITGGLDPVGDNVNVIGCDLDYLYVDGTGGVIANNTIHGSVVDGIGGSASAFTIAGNAIWNHTDCGMELAGVNNTITNNTIWDVGSGIKLTGGGHVIEGNDIRHLYDNDACHVDTGTGLTFRYNYLYGPSNASTSTISTGIALLSVTDAIIEWNTFDSFNGTGDGYGIALTDAGCTNATIQYNNFTGCWFGITTGAVANPIRYNWFKDTFNPFEEMNGVNSTVYENNYYFEYFDAYPTDVTVNVSTNVLESPFLCSHSRSHGTDPPQTRYDLAPLYHEDWYPRSDQVYFQFYSEVDYQGVPFDQLQLYLDGVRVTTSSPVIEHVLFNVTVRDYSGRLLHSEIFNVNASVYINIGLDVSVSVHFRFYSTLDYFGLPFELVKLYVNGTRITTPSPTMRPAVINIVVRDYADIVIYNATVDLATTGIYLDIGLALAPITIVNDYNRTVVFMLIRGTTTTRLAMASGMQLGLRLALGDYSYIVSETDGTELKTNDVIFSASQPAGFVISFGWTDVAPDVITVYQAQLLDYMLMIAFFAVVVGVVLYAGWLARGAGRDRPRARPRAVEAPVSRHGRGRPASGGFVRVFRDLFKPKNAGRRSSFRRW